MNEVKAKPRWRFSLSTKIFAGLGIVLLLLIAIDLRSVYQLRQIGNHLRLLNRSYLPLAKLASLLDSLQSNRRVDLNRFARLPPKQWDAQLLRRLRYPQAILQRLRSSDRILQRMERSKLEQNPRFMKALRRSFTQITSLLHRASGLLVELQANKLLRAKEPTFQRLHREFVQTERQLQREIGSLSIKMDFRLTQVGLDAERREGRAMWVLLFLSAFGILICVGVLFLSRIPIRRIVRLAEATQRFGEGDDHTPVEDDSFDEIGVLAQEFNRMTLAVREREHNLAQKQRELKQAYHDLQLSSERLRRSERLAAIGQLAAQITHEVRNPLNAIGLNLELLEEDLEQAPNAEEALAVLQASMDEVERLTLITEEYLRFASLPTPKLEPVQLNALLEDMMEFLRTELHGRGVEWKLEVGEAVPMVNVDQRQLRQALLNLLRNAMQAASMTSTDQARLSVWTRQAENGVEIEIRDNGPGIPDEAREKIFDPFFSTKEEGTGLGLPLTQQIIIGHGGTIRCESPPGEGISFLLFIPDD